MDQRAAARAPGSALTLELVTETIRAAGSESEAATEAALIADVDVPALLADARKNPPPGQSRARATLDRILIAGARTSAEARAAFARELLDPKLPRRAFGPIAAALSHAGSPECQAILVDVAMKREKGLQEREQAMYSLARVVTPTEATLDALDRWAHDPTDPWRGSARDFYGTAVGQALASGTSALPRLERLIADYRNANDSPARVEALLVLGNVADARIEPVVVGALGAADEQIRAEAARALRLVPTETARSKLLSTARSDPAKMVRIAALESSLVRPPNDATADTFADRAEHDSDEDVRRSATIQLGLLCHRTQAARKHVDRLKKSGDELVRRELASF